MTEVVTLIEVGFDGLENHAAAARTERVIGVFVADRHLSAHGVCGDWLRAQPPRALYLGWDGEVYPQFRVESRTANI